MRLGAPLRKKFANPEEWASEIKNMGFSAAFCPIGPESSPETVKDFLRTAAREDILITSVGAWSNPLSSDEKERKEAKNKCKIMLRLADELRARCCVNISGSRGQRWDGPDEKNLTEETFCMIVETVREIIDEVKPQNTFYTLETMPWMYPESADSYVALLKAVDRKAFAVHFDPVNLINGTERYFSNGKLIRDFVEKLGNHIKSCHAKDIILRDTLTVHLDEVRPGAGNLDYPVFLKAVESIDEDMPVIIEHLKSDDEYLKAAEYIRKVASEQGITVKS